MLDDTDIRMIGIGCNMQPHEEDMLRRIVTGTHYDDDYAYNSALKMAQQKARLLKSNETYIVISTYINLALKAFANGRGATGNCKRIVLRCKHCKTQWYAFIATLRKNENCPMCNALNQHVLQSKL